LFPAASATYYPTAMNEQLIVKNFGPIKDATVDFKRVTVFIGPTGGGKSTLAKLAAVFRDEKYAHSTEDISKDYYNKYNLKSHFTNTKINTTFLRWNIGVNKIIVDSKINKQIRSNAKSPYSSEKLNTFIKLSKTLNELKKEYIENNKIFDTNRINIIKIIELQKENIDAIESIITVIGQDNIKLTNTSPIYIPSERIFIAALEYSWAGIMRDDIGLPKALLDFANDFSLSRKDIAELSIPFISVKYLHIDGRDFIKIPEREEPLMLLETASGIQSVTPMLVLLEHLSQQQEQAQSFIIEEPELNLYPTAQQGLMNWLVEKCTAGENDLTITTHSPYILSSCNLLIEAYKVWQKRPELEAEIDKIVPKASWINPDEFAAYYVADGGVQPIVDERTDLIGGNELDSISGDIADSFRKLLRLQKQPANA